MYNGVYQELSANTLIHKYRTAHRPFSLKVIQNVLSYHVIPTAARRMHFKLRLMELFFILYIFAPY